MRPSTLDQSLIDGLTGWVYPFRVAPGRQRGRPLLDNEEITVHLVDGFGAVLVAPLHSATGRMRNTRGRAG